MKLYNTQTKNKVEFKGKKTSLYACGPTVYDRAHIGNLRTYLNIDLLRRALKYFRYDVRHVMNITDIEDKIIAKSKESNVSYKDFTAKYEDLFWQDLEKLNIAKPDVAPHATDDEVIAKMIAIISHLLKNGFAYKSDDGSVYFAVDKFSDYGKLSHLDKKGIRSGARVAQDEYDKDNAQDFALWKKAKEDEPSWEAPFGEGRPGWHIECSAMSMLYFGETIDIHAGGVDLVFPHHENEVAQSEAYTGKQFVKHWFHGEHLLVEGKKMSKSLGNLYTIDDLNKKFSVEPLAFRMMILQSHYRDKLNFTEKSIKDAQNTLINLRNFINRVSQSSGNDDVSAVIEASRNKFENALKDDLNTPKAMASLFDFITEINKLETADKSQVLDYIRDVDAILGLNLTPDKIEVEVRVLFEEYLKARKEKNFEKSDEMRKKISDLGWLTEDLKCESILRKK